MAVAKKTKRDAPGSKSDMINKKVRSAHNTMKDKGVKGVDDNWAGITNKAKNSKAIRSALQKKKKK